MEPLDIERIFASAARKRVLHYIEAHPGVSVTEVARAIDLYWSAVAMHVVHLQAAGLVSATRLGRRRLVFPTSSHTKGDEIAATFLSEPACRHVAATIVEHPRRTVWQVRVLTQMSERAVYHHVKRLVDAGLVLSHAKRGYRALEATPTLVAAVARMRDGPPPHEGRP